MEDTFLIELKSDNNHKFESAIIPTLSAAGVIKESNDYRIKDTRLENGYLIVIVEKNTHL